MPAVLDLFLSFLFLSSLAKNGPQDHVSEAARVGFGKAFVRLRRGLQERGILPEDKK